MIPDEEVRLVIGAVCDRIKETLLEKNRRYGNSSTNPIRIFSKASSEEQLLVRIDDKLSRISRGDKTMVEDEDVIKDLAGYLILLLVAREARIRSNL